METGNRNVEDAAIAEGPAADHFRSLLAATESTLEALETRLRFLGLVSLGLFLGGVIVGLAGFSQNRWPLLLTGVALLFGFVLCRIAAGRTLKKQVVQEATKRYCEQHLLRLCGDYSSLPPSGKAPPLHPYAADVDLFGSNSLAQRLDVSQTKKGEAILAEWLGAPAELEEITARQKAVEELATKFDTLGQGLEVAGMSARDIESADVARLDPEPFLTFTKREPIVTGWLVPLIFGMPLLALGMVIAYLFQLVPPSSLFGVLAIQAVLALVLSGRAIDVFQLIAARRGYVEALSDMLVLIEEETFESELLTSIQARVSVSGVAPSDYMRRLDRWAGFAEFYTQFPVHFFVNLVTFWDLHVLRVLESWNAQVGSGLEDAFEALGELEALSSLATLRIGTETTMFPEVSDAPVAFSCESIAHPLIPPSERIENDVMLPAESGVIIITGSNMAGKSTLLRAVGLNLALAFAGGPVIAKRFVTPRYRLRASMRVDDSLQEGASYFHAELKKLGSVVGDADAKPPVFFILDELLRGTNARARHIGARAVIDHLLKAGASGLTATHDIALSKMEDEKPERVANAHFTDVMKDGEMLFDYRLRDGVVKTSNALRLLEMVGVEVETDDLLPTSIG